VVGNCGFLLAGLIRRSSPLGRLRPVTLPLSILAVTAAVLLFTGGIPADGFGGCNGLPSFRCVAGWSSQGSSCCAKLPGVTRLVRLAVRRPFA
jgi:hypothetical protein